MEARNDSRVVFVRQFEVRGFEVMCQSTNLDIARPPYIASAIDLMPVTHLAVKYVFE